MELDIALLALTVDELEGVDTPALHMPPIRWYTIIVQQIRQLHMVHSQMNSGTHIGGSMQTSRATEQNDCV